jgi:hypothetical protein
MDTLNKRTKYAFLVKMDVNTVPFVSFRLFLPQRLFLMTPSSLIKDVDTLAKFHSLYFQAQGQAKPSYKNRSFLCEDDVDWILLMGPYWTLVRLGPFSNAELFNPGT